MGQASARQDVGGASLRRAFRAGQRRVGLRQRTRPRVGRSDFVSIHARATADNADLIDAAALGQMKPGAFLINTARETLVDEEALDDALTSG
ncbi:MAG: NAD(P)-dependent oxidoreductase [Solirubrobacteraceae bacterium]